MKFTINTEEFSRIAMNIQKIDRIGKPRCTASTLTGLQCKKNSDKTGFCNVHKKTTYM